MPNVPARKLSKGELLENKRRPKPTTDKYPNLYYAKVGNLWYALRERTLNVKKPTKRT